MTDESQSNNRQEKPEEARQERAILAFTRKEFKIFNQLRPGGREKRPILGGLTRIVCWPGMILAGPMIGAPQAVMAMELISLRGVRTYLSLGWCGALDKSLSIGHIVLPDSAYSEEGTSRLYPVEGASTPDPDLVEKLGEALGGDFTSGRIWSTDAPFMETREKINQHTADGILAVDMETSALITVARYRHLKWAGLVVVSDLLWGEEWRHGFNSPELTAGLTRAAEAILNVMD